MADGNIAVTVQDYRGQEARELALWAARGLVEREQDAAPVARAYGEACAETNRDCRVCANFTTKTGGCMSVAQCVDGDCFKPTRPHQYWAIRARGET